MSHVNYRFILWKVLGRDLEGVRPEKGGQVEDLSIWLDRRHPFLPLLRSLRFLYCFIRRRSTVLLLYYCCRRLTLVG